MVPGNILLIVVLVLLPLVPAYTLFRWLPSDGSVEGPFHGTKLKFGGAFAGYLVLFLALTQVSAGMPQHEVWVVRGQLAFADDAGTFDEHSVRFTLRPPGISLHPDGSFRLTLIRMPDETGEAELPTVIVEHPGYAPVRLDLDNAAAQARRRQVVMADTLVLRPRPELDPHEH